MQKIEKDLIVANKKGLHARPAAIFVGLVEKYNVTVTITKDVGSSGRDCFKDNS